MVGLILNQLEVSNTPLEIVLVEELDVFSIENNFSKSGILGISLGVSRFELLG
jgi:hypothetical protein